MNRIKLEIFNLTHGVSQSQSYAVVLGETEGRRRLPIVIGMFEAQAIAVAMEGVTPTRPLTHDLIRNIFELLEIKLKEIVIDNLKEGIFYSKLICINGDQEIEIDSRTSDALAMAVRFNCPIYTYEFILDKAAIIVEDSDVSEGGEESETPEEVPVGAEEPELAGYSLEELNTKLQEVLDKEDYELAIQIRDEIDKRRSENS